MCAPARMWGRWDLEATPLVHSPLGYTPHHQDLKTQSLRTKRKKKEGVAISCCFLPLSGGNMALEGSLENEGVAEVHLPSLSVHTPKHLIPLKSCSHPKSESEGCSHKASLPPRATRGCQPSATPHPHLLEAALHAA